MRFLQFAYNHLLRSLPSQGFVLIVATASVYFRVCSFGFVNCDDGQYVYENPWVRNGISMQSVFWAFSTLHGGVSYWHPLTWLSHQLDCQLFGLTPGVHHLTNLWFYLGSVVLVLLLLQQLGLGRGRAFFLAAVFALHPLHVESVAWISERKDVLYGFCWLLAFYSYVRARLERRTSWFAWAIVAYLAALMSKPAAVTLPVVLILYECLLYPRRLGPPDVKGGPRAFHWEGMRRYWIVLPFLIPAVVLCVLTLIAQREVGALQNLTVLPFQTRLGNALLSYASYIRNAIWPVDLYYGYLQGSGPGSISLSLAALSLAGLSVLFVKMSSERALCLFGWLWYLLTLVPNLGIVQAGAQCMADRYMYLPIIGLACAFAGAAPGLVSIRSLPRARTLGLCVLLFFAVLSSRQLRQWKDGVTLFTRTLVFDQDNWIAQLGLGMALTEQRQYDRALSHLRRATELPGNRAEAYRMLGMCHYWKGDLSAACENLERSCHLDPTSSATCFALAEIYLSGGNQSCANRERALCYAEKGLGRSVQPSTGGWLKLAQACLACGRRQGARSAAAQALQIARQQRDRAAIILAQSTLKSIDLSQPAEIQSAKE